jgi:hypothetical protein
MASFLAASFKPILATSSDWSLTISLRLAVRSAARGSLISRLPAMVWIRARSTAKIANAPSTHKNVVPVLEVVTGEDMAWLIS